MTMSNHEYIQFDISTFPWSNKIDSVSYMKESNNLKIRIISGTTIKYIMIPYSVYFYTFNKFNGNEEQTMTYLVENAVMMAFGDILVDKCSWEQYDKVLFDVNELLRDIDKKTDELDKAFKALEKEKGNIDLG